MVSDVQSAHSTSIKINADANIYVTELEPGQSVSMQIARGRQAYLVCVEESITVSIGSQSEALERHDAAEIYSEGDLVVANSTPGGTSHVLVVEMAQSGRGRTDIP